MYIYEQKEWPDFSWDEKRIAPLLTEVRHQQGRLLGGMETIGFDLSDRVFLDSLTLEVVKTSEIEGEILDQTLVRSSVARHLGVEKAALNKIDQNVEGIVEIMLDATQNFDRALTQKRIFGWHQKLFPEGRRGFKAITVGGWRKGTVEVVSGHMGREKVHFEAPPSERVSKEMALFLEWMREEKEMDAVLKGAMAHLWFVTIHPFDDGNGRIARAIGDLLLAQSEKNSRRFYSLSAQIQKERKDYYAILEKTQKGELDITPWLEWLLGCLGRAIEDAQATLQMIVNKAKYFEKISEMPLNARQKKVLHRLLEDFQGKLTTSKWAKMTKCSQDTALRDITQLIEWGILTKDSGGGRNTSYSLYQ